MRRRVVSAAVSLALLLGAASASVELTAVNVRKGDALILRLDGYTALIDTGKANAFKRVEYALDAAGIDALDAVFITHTDKDHVGGLKKLVKSGIEIGALYASKYHPQVKRKDHPVVENGERLGIDPVFLGAGDVIELGDTGARLRVLMPVEEIPENEDDNSLVMMLECPEGRILLTGDMEYGEEAQLLARGEDLRCDILKVPNHADDDACSRALADACMAQVAIISTSSEDKPGTPAPEVIDALKSAGSAIYVTQDSVGGIRATLDGGVVSVEILDDGYVEDEEE